MDFERLQTLYPNATLVETPSNESGILCLPYHTQWIKISTNELKLSEIQLLQALFPIKKETKKALSHSIWYQFLWQAKPLPSTKKGNYRVIQFTLSHPLDSENQFMWLEAFSQVFPACEDYFFINPTTGVLIQEQTKNDFTLEELSGVIQALEDDFSIKVFCYIGHFWQLTTDFPKLFHEEQSIFNQQQQTTKNPVLSLSQIALAYYTKTSTEKSFLMKTLKDSLSEQVDWQELVQILWETQGNLSLAAKKLYIHRNTLQYRIDRFLEATSFSLKDQNDLTLCYLLVLI